MTARGAFDWCFRSRDTGAVTIGQFPNLALWIFLATVPLRWVLPDGGLRTTVGWIGTAALAWWAVDELVRGVNPWRRLLGAVFLGLVVLRVAGAVL